MIVLRFWALFCLCGLLAGCATRPVVVVEKKEFLRMAHNMSKEMQARNLLDKDGDYVAPLSLAGMQNYGDILFRRLSPSFMHQPDTVHDIYLGPVFAATIQPDSRVRHWDNGFSIDHATQKIVVNMVAIADWDNDGRDEWIVSCLVEPKRGGRTRTYYVLVPPPDNGREKLEGTLAAIYECFGLACSLYVRDSKVIRRDAADPLAPPTEVHDVLPGLQTITTPPDAHAPVTGGLEERNL